MNTNKLKTFCHQSTVIIAAAGMLVGCASASNTGNTATIANATSRTDAVKKHPTQPKQIRLHLSDVQSIGNTRVFCEDTGKKNVYDIKSGTEDDGVWVEGCGIFNLTTDQIYADITDPVVMGPSYLTDDIKSTSIEDDGETTSYVMDVHINYLMFNVSFSIKVDITRIYDDTDNSIGYYYVSKKDSGTSFITDINENLIIQRISDSTVRVDIKSQNVASLKKEKETRSHIESVFKRWASSD